MDFALRKVQLPLDTVEPEVQPVNLVGYRGVLLLPIPEPLREIARVEAGAQGTDTRFAVTNLAGGPPRTLYEDLYCRQGQAENHIKSWETHLSDDCTSCHSASANQRRLMLHTGTNWLMWSPRRLMPARPSWRVAQFDTLRLRLLKIAARVVTWKTKVLVRLPSTCPGQAILRLVLECLPRPII